MLLIGLAGGSVPSRARVARTLQEKAQAAVAVWEVEGNRVGSARAKTLRRSLDNSRAGRMPADVLVYSHVLTEEEAQVIRAAGGFVWHVFGVPSNHVVIRRGDLLVIDRPGGDRHWLDPIEAYSEAMLAKAAG